jgi:hypothetical protein
MYTNRIFNLRQLNKDQESGGGEPFMSIEDLDIAEDEAAKGQSKIPNLEEEAAKQDKEEKKPEEGDPKPEDKPEDKKPEEKKPATDPEPVTDPEDKEPETEGTFWDDVDALRGEALDVDFGDVDPASPEGALVYEKAVRADELQKFEDNLAAAHPRAYALIEHLLDGGKEEDFFKLAGEPTELPTEAELENSIELQKTIVTRNLKSMGNSDKQIERIIKGSIEDDDLEEMAKDALKQELKRGDDALKAAQAQTESERTHKAEKLNEMKGYIDDVVATGKIDNIVIPEKDRKEFAKAFASSVRIENGKYVTVTEISNDNIAKLLKEKFFGFKNGDLANLIEKAAATANTKRLQRTITTTQKKPLGQGQRNESSLTTLSEMDD